MQGLLLLPMAWDAIVAHLMLLWTKLCHPNKSQ